MPDEQGMKESAEVFHAMNRQQIERMGSAQQMESAPSAMCEDRVPRITFERRCELSKAAEKIAEQIMRRCRPHEIHLLRRMIDNLLERDY